MISDYSSLFVPFSYQLLLQILAVSTVAIVVVIYLFDLRARIHNIQKPKQKLQAPRVRVVEIGSSYGGSSVFDFAGAKQRHCSSCGVIMDDMAIYCDVCGAKQSDKG